MRIIREGGKYGVYSKARRYVKHNFSEFDIIVDEVNTVPFRIHRMIQPKPVVAVIHQLAREIWFYETSFPINAIGYYVLEPFWLREYRQVPTITVSNSTRIDLVSRGFENVCVVPNGVDYTPTDRVPQKEENPVLIFMGRFVRSKLPEHAIAAFEQIKRSYPNAELWMVGDGYLRSRLQAESPNGVRFFGRVDNKEKFDLLARAHVLLVPSVREGWGISVIEANSVGTPAVGYAVPGLRDSIVDGTTGYTVEPLNRNALARATLSLLADPSAWANLSNNAIAWSRQFSWDDASNKFLSALQVSINVD
jgi:glycosyltransferase involved in cell wall biosynthesis